MNRSTQYLSVRFCFSCCTILYSCMLHFQGAGSSNEVSCFHRFTCSIRSNSHCSTGMFTGYGLAISAQPLDGQFLTSISGHQMPSPCQRIPSRPLHGHFWTAISAPPFPDANLRRPDKRILPTFCQVLCNFLRSSSARFLIPSRGRGSLPALRSGSLALCGAQVPPLG